MLEQAGRNSEAESIYLHHLMCWEKNMLMRTKFILVSFYLSFHFVYHWVAYYFVYLKGSQTQLNVKSGCYTCVLRQEGKYGVMHPKQRDEEQGGLGQPPKEKRKVTKGRRKSWQTSKGWCNICLKSEILQCAVGFHSVTCKICTIKTKTTW